MKSCCEFQLPAASHQGTIQKGDWGPNSWGNTRWEGGTWGRGLVPSREKGAQCHQDGVESLTVPSGSNDLQTRGQGLERGASLPGGGLKSPLSLWDCLFLKAENQMIMCINDTHPEINATKMETY